MAIFGVSPNGEQWQVTREGQVVSLHDDREDAVRTATEAAEQDDGQVLVVDEHHDVTDVLGDGSGTPEGRQGTDVPDPVESR